jgi:hypothetical protein
MKRHVAQKFQLLKKAKGAMDALTAHNQRGAMISKFPYRTDQ